MAKLTGMIEKETARKIVSSAFDEVRKGRETFNDAKARIFKEIEEAQDLYSWHPTDQLLPEDTDLARIQKGSKIYINVVAYVRDKYRYGRPMILRREYRRGRWWWSNGFAGDEVDYWMAVPRRPSKQTIARSDDDDNDS